MRKYCLLVFSLLILLTLSAAALDGKPTGWQQVQGLGPHTRVRIKSDKETAICFIHSVDEEQLTCGRSEAIGSPVLVFPRQEIKTITFTKRSIATSINAGYVDDLLAGRLIYQR